MKSVEQLFNEGGSQEPAGSMHLTPLRDFLVHRLCWLERWKKECARHLGPEDWRMRLLDKAMYSTYRDCVEQGVEEEARIILGKFPIC